MRSRYRTSRSGVQSRPTVHVPQVVQPTHQTQIGSPQAKNQPTEKDPRQQVSKPLKPRFSFGYRWLVGLIIFLIVGLLVLMYGYLDTKNRLETAKSSNSLIGKTETEQIVNQLSKFIVLPSGEDPSLLSVNDVSQLKDQQFFKNAQNGDKVLIYKQSGKALIYRPSTKMVIEYAPVNL